MALTFPQDGNWIVWPHFSSGPGLINGQDASSRYASLRGFTHQVTSNSFAVSGVLDRHKGAVQHAFFFTSLPGDITVYIERLRTAGRILPCARGKPASSGWSMNSARTNTRFSGNTAL